ncbi:MAG: hypothetical protein R2707_04140 [Acidimicrobiales bacterium]
MNERNQSRRKRPRSRNRSGGANAPASGQGAQKKDAPKVDLREFWGDPELLPDRIDGIRHSPDVRAVLTSLGRPPLTGNETPAEHWFSLVYERAAFLAGALAAAGALEAVDDSAENG